MRTKPRKFTVAGPCQPERHFMLPAAERLPQIPQLIEDQLYFVVYGPRQTGKTTALLALAQELTASSEYASILVSMQMGRAFGDDIGAAELAILDSWRLSATYYLPAELQPPSCPDASAGARIRTTLQTWAMASPRPLVLFLDEIDALQDDTLISILHQIRDGYSLRPNGFPSSLALIGMRDVRDYKVASGGSERLNTSSPFNIKTESLLLHNFTAEEVAALYQQHTDDTGQVFMPDAVEYAFEQTQGQPWLVNALARQMTENIVPDRTKPITLEHVDKAKQALIKRQDTHLDSLGARLLESRIRQVIAPLLVGGVSDAVPLDDIRFVKDLGLCRTDPQHGLVVANPIYQEVLPRVLAEPIETYIPYLQPIWLTPDGKLDAGKLLEAFLAFWRQHAAPLFKSAPYHEIAPHLVMMAFLHRVVNAGGTIEREYAVGSGRMDLCIHYRDVTLAIELKVWHDYDRTSPLKEGLEQLDQYLAGLTLNTGWLVIFDRRSNQPPIEDRTTTEEATTPTNRHITVVWA